MKESQYKYVVITRNDLKKGECVEMVTDIRYFVSYIVVTYMKTIDEEETLIIPMDGVAKISVGDIKELDAKRKLMHIAERTAGIDFEKIRFFPYNDDTSRVTITSHRKAYPTEFTYDRVSRMERKWDHDLRSHKILIHTIHNDAGLVWSGIDAIYVFDESDIRSIKIERTEMKDIIVNVNGGKYDAES